MSVVYELFGAPSFDKSFSEMTKSEALAYKNWFVGVAPERLARLVRLVRSFEGFEKWEPDGSLHSLDELAELAPRLVKTRARAIGEDEVVIQAKKVSYTVKRPPSLTEETVSVCVDVAIYFSSMVLRALPGAFWAVPLGSRRNVDYGQPVISTGKKVVLNPVQVMKVVYPSIPERGVPELRKIYLKWVANLS